MSEKVANKKAHENNSRLQQDQKVDFTIVLFNTHHVVFLGQFFFFIWQQASNFYCMGSSVIWKTELDSHCPHQSERNDGILVIESSVLIK